MKIKITSNPITMYGSFSHGQILTDDQYPSAFLIHLVEEAKAAEWIERENKIEQAKETKIEAPKETKTSKKKSKKKSGS